MYKLLIWCNKYTLLHELACNIASYCTSGRGIFTSRRRVKMQPMSEIIAICMLTSVIKCLLSIPEYRLVSSHAKYRVTHRSKLCKVTEGVGFPDTLPTFCFSAKEGQLVQVMVSSYTCPTFVLSVAVVLLVVLLLKSRKSAACPELPSVTVSILIKAHRSC